MTVEITTADGTVLKIAIPTPERPAPTFVPMDVFTGSIAGQVSGRAFTPGSATVAY